MSAKTKTITAPVVFLTLMVLFVSGASGAGLKQSQFDSELQKIRYGIASQAYSYKGYYASIDDDVALSELAQAEALPPNYKSPGRAFLYSLAIPGLGQYYYGSKIKPVLFVAVEVVGLMQALKYHGEGNDKTVEFEQFNHDHWFRTTYEDYLMTAYNSLRPDEVDPGDPDTLDENYTKGFTHVLPDEMDQQYCEMTGKYNQFAWGWDDAQWREDEGQPWYDWEQYQAAHPGPEVRILNDETTPYSVNRIEYEKMRNDANERYDKSMKFVFVLMANHLVSAFEAYFVTKSHNKKLRYEQEFARLNVDAKLRSYSSWKDTPYLTVSYRF